MAARPNTAKIQALIDQPGTVGEGQLPSPRSSARVRDCRQSHHTRTVE